MFEAMELTKCPFCGGEISISLDVENKPDGALHTLPVCKKFEEIDDALEFIIEVRRELERKAGKPSSDV